MIRACNVVSHDPCRYAHRVCGDRVCALALADGAPCAIGAIRVVRVSLTVVIYPLASPAFRVEEPRALRGR